MQILVINAFGFGSKASYLLTWENICGTIIFDFWSNKNDYLYLVQISFFIDRYHSCLDFIFISNNKFLWTGKITIGTASFKSDDMK